MARTVDIPGGKATFADSIDELSPRRRRPIELLSARLGQLMGPLKTAGRILIAGDVAEDRTSQVDDNGGRLFPGPDIDLTESQYATLRRLGDVITVGLLLGWTLDQPAPATEDDLLDLDPAVYDAVVVAAARINAGFNEGGFTVDEAMDARDEDGELDKTLPTGA